MNPLGVMGEPISGRKSLILWAPNFALSNDLMESKKSTPVRA